MKLGGAVMQLINMHRKKQGVFKQRFYDLWKLHTLMGLRADHSQQRLSNSRASSGMIQVVL
jgi:hypothetical protein